MKAIWRPALALVGVSGLLAGFEGKCSSRPEYREPSPSAAAAIVLTGRGFGAKAEDVRWIDPPTKARALPLGTYRFVAILRQKNEPEDVWLGAARLSPEGRWLGLSALHNLSDTSAVAETALTVSAGRIAWEVTDGNDVAAIQVVDVKGRALPTNGEMSLLERWQTRLTFLQETGQLSGLCRRAYRFNPARKDVALSWTAAGLEVRSGAEHGTLRCDGATLDDLGATAEPSELGSPGDLVTWAVDRVRALPWVGSDRMQWIKAVAFNLFDRLDSARQRVTNAQLDDKRTSDFSSPASSREPDPESGWPPRPMTPILAPAADGEGIFRPLDDDPFATVAEGVLSPFAISFVRPDATHRDSQIFVLAWDPRLVELHTMTGTREPKTATGETGSGMVPRASGVVGRLAAAFNGGFQATHGEFGMMAEEVVYLPPKPYAATIVEQGDGTLGFGTWPNDDVIPDTFVGFRQNLTPLVSDERVNAYARTWWGGVPEGWQDATRTVRTGLCLTKEHFVAYFYGSSTSADHLAKAMVSAGCEYGVHLDMNPGHTGFEFYRVGKAGSLPRIERKLDTTWETRGTVPGLSGWEFLGRRMLRGMHLMHFPRYVRTDSRDFFYLTHRHILPPRSTPAPNEVPPAEHGAWETRGHDQHGFPAAIASTKFHPDPTRPGLTVAIVVMDSKWLTPCIANCNDAATVLRMNRASRGSLRVYHHHRHFLVAKAPPAADAVPVVFGHDESSAPARVVAAVGVAHHEWLFYAEVTDGGDRLRDTQVLKRLLTEQGCDERIYLEHSLSMTLGRDRGSSPRAELTWLRNESSMATRVFPDTGVVPPSVWRPLQDQRVRYVRRRSIDATTRRATEPDENAIGPEGASDGGPAAAGSESAE
jgi:hypothetical protein